MKQILILLTICMSVITFANDDGKEKKGYEIGDVATDFNLINIDETKVNLAQFEEAKGFIVIFTCNHCPFSVKYEDRIIELDKKYKALGYPVVAISPNDVEAFPEDDLAHMKIRAAEKAFTFPYLYDETQEIAKAYGATKTPHVFLLNKEQKDEQEVLVVKYIGAVDDSTRGNNIEEKYVEMAIEALQKGEKVDPSVTKAVGCSVKWKK